MMEPWDVDTGEIVRRLVEANVLPEDPRNENDRDDLVDQWHESLRRQRQTWRKKWLPKLRQRKQK